MSPNTKAFTLLELLLAVILMGFLLAVVAGIVHGVLASAGGVSAAIGDDASAAEIEDVIAEDLAFVIVPKKDGALTVKDEGGGMSSLGFYSACGPKTAWGDAVLTVHRVEYSVKPTLRGGRGLFRREQPLVKTSGAYYDSGVLLAGDVASFFVEAYDGAEWRTQWPPDKGGPLPAFLRVTIVIAPAGGSRRTIFVESAPAVESASRPEPERRSSGSKPQLAASQKPAAGQPSGGAQELPSDEGGNSAQEPNE